MKRPFRLNDTRPAARRDVADELRFHLDMRAAEFVEGGMPPDEARRAAAAAFGDPAAVECEVRALEERRARGRRWRVWRWEVAADVRYALRTLRRSRLFAAVAVLTLALGMGSAAAVFTLVNGVLLRPLPYADPARLLMVWTTGDGLRGRETQWPLSAANYQDVKARARSLGSLAAFRAWPYTLAGSDAGSEMLAGARVAPELFATLGVRPLVGRAFTADEGRAGGPRAVVLGYELWQRRFGGSPAVVGTPVTLSGERYTVVGVMPPRFAFPRGTELPSGFQFSPRTELWTPLVFTDDDLALRGTNNLAAVARLRPGADAEGARAELAHIASRLAAEHPREFGARMGLDAVTLKEQAAAPVRRGLLLLMGAVALVLLIACANVANLLVARAAQRDREFTVRMALGATGGRLFRQLAVENVLLTAAGAVLALAAAAGATRLLLVRVLDELPRTDDVAVDGRVIGATLAAALAAGIVFAAATALRVGVRRPVAGRGGHGTRATAGRRERAGRRLLVATEVALSLVLLVGAGLLMRSFVALQRVPPGFEARGVMTAGLLLPIGARFDPARDGARWAAHFSEYADRVSALPGVVAAGGVSSLPLTGAVETAGFTVEGRPRPAGAPAPSASYSVVVGDYFRAMGVPVVAGRAFDGRDRAGGVRVVVVSASFAERYWPGERAGDVLGHRVMLGFGDTVPHAVVGVVGDVRQMALDAVAVPSMYFPVSQFPYPRLSFVARVRDGAPEAVLPPMRRALAALDPALALHDVRPLRAVVAESLARQRASTAVAAYFAVAALALAAVGLYGVIATSVSQRTRELGVRLALGATPRGVVALVVRDGLRTTALGVAAGVLGALAAGRLLRGQLYAVNATDPGVYLLVVCLTTVVALAAAYLPARRTARLDPAVTLRGD